MLFVSLLAVSLRICGLPVAIVALIISVLAANTEFIRQRYNRITFTVVMFIFLFGTAISMFSMWTMLLLTPENP